MSRLAQPRRKLEDLTGRTFGRLTVIEDPRHGIKVLARCACDPNSVKWVYRHSLIRGELHSCGCLHREVVSRPKGKDLTGVKFGRWTVIERVRVNDTNSRWRWLCRCGCKAGTQRVVRGQDLLTGSSVSCGCYQRECVTKHGHGQRGSLTYCSWTAMIDRCHGSDPPPGYADRGITVCERWRGEHGFENFLADMGERPSREYTIDRKDNDGNYEPTNCRWATKKEQSNNRRDTVFFEWHGQRTPLTDICRQVGAPRNAVYLRVRRGWSLERALQEAVKPQLGGRAAAARVRNPPS